MDASDTDDDYLIAYHRTMNISSTSFSNCSAFQEGGAVYSVGNLNLTDVRFDTTESKSTDTLNTDQIGYLYDGHLDCDTKYDYCYADDIELFISPVCNGFTTQYEAYCTSYCESCAPTSTPTSSPPTVAPSQAPSTAPTPAPPCGAGEEPALDTGGCDKCDAGYSSNSGVQVKLVSR